MARLVPDMANLDEDQRAFLRAIVEGKRGQSVAVGASHGPPNGLFGVLLLAPVFGQQMQHFGAHVRYDTSLPTRLSELAILACARHWRAEYEYWAHAPIARNAGLSDDIVESIRIGAEPDIEDETESAVFAFSRELLERREVSDSIFARALALLGEVAVIELVGVLGYYSLVAMMVKAAQIGVPDASHEPMP